MALAATTQHLFFQNTEMEVYIRSIGNISPQATQEPDYFAEHVRENEGSLLTCIEAEYRNYIDAMARRRMGRIIRRGIAAAKICLENTGVEKPDAIITGTGLGSIEDTESFLQAILDNNEVLLNPTSFIQSTYNSISTQIAISLGCHKYNSTYVHRAFSFESALLDAMMLINEGMAENALVGGTDEITEKHSIVTSRNHHWKKEEIKNTGLLASKTEGSLAGEGCTFFLVSNKPGAENFASIKDVQTFFKNGEKEFVAKKILNFLETNKLNPQDIDLFLTGMNGDLRFDHYYTSLHSELFPEAVLGAFKHLCGEYFTASAFALWLGANILKHQKIPLNVICSAEPKTNLNHILIYNHYQNNEHAMILLSKTL